MPFERSIFWAIKFQERFPMKFLICEFSLISSLILQRFQCMTSQVKFVGSLGTKDFLNIMIGVENRVMIVLNIMKGIKTGSKYYVFNIGVENRVKFFREKTQENLGMKTWIPQWGYSCSMSILILGTLLPTLDYKFDIEY